MMDFEEEGKVFSAWGRDKEKVRKANEDIARRKAQGDLGSTVTNVEVDGEDEVELGNGGEEIRNLPEEDFRIDR